MTILKFIAIFLPLPILILGFLVANKLKIIPLLIPLFGLIGIYFSIAYLIAFGKNTGWQKEIAVLIQKYFLNNTTSLIFIIAFEIIIIISLVFFFRAKLPLNLRGELVINSKPINAVGEIWVVGLQKHFVTNNNGFFKFSISDEGQTQLTLRGQFQNWLGSKTYDKGNFLSIELPLIAQKIDDQYFQSSEKSKLAILSGFSIGDSAYIIEKEKLQFALFTHSILEILNKEYQIPIQDLFLKALNNMANYEELNSPMFWISQTGLMEENIFDSSIYSKANSFLLSIGLDRYEDNNISRLVYSVEDARKMNHFFSKTLNVSSYLLTNAAAIKNAVFRKLNSIKNSKKDFTQVIIYLSGHFIFFNDQHYFLMYDSSIVNFQYNSLTVSDIYSYIIKSKIKRVIFIIDGGEDISHYR